MPLRLRSAGGGSVQLNSPVALSTDVAMEVPAYDGAKVLTDKTPGVVLQVITNKGTSAFGSFTTTSTTPVSIGYSVTITPTSSTSKILYMFSCNTRRIYGSSYFDLYINGVKDAISGRGSGNFGSVTKQLETYLGNHLQTHLQTAYSPGSTDPITYDIRLSTDSGGTAEIWGYGVPMVTVMEIAA